MMVDASAIVAILLDEPDARRLAERLEGSPTRLTHPVSVYEAALAVAREWRSTVEDGLEDVAAFLQQSEADVVSIGSAETRAALSAFALYGKGRHAARLNMGDCFSYACAKLRGMPLLYKGDDFAQTDLA